jgi:hypothetical protein
MDSGKASQPRQARKPAGAAAHIAAAATIDELLASEARAGLRRSREGAREDIVPYKPRVPVPSARIVVRPSQPQTWMAPFIALAIVVGVSTVLSAGTFAYLLLRPMVADTAHNGELGSLRETVTILRRHVAELSAGIAANRATSDIAAKGASERSRPDVARIVLASPIAAIDPTPERRAPAVPAAANDPPPEVTGSLQQMPRSATAARAVLAGWQVRRAYDGIALLEGKSGVIEVSPGQDIPDLGRVQEIKNDNGRWQVITSKGVILPAR